MISNQIEKWQMLVDELNKKQPDQVIIKKLMKEFDLKYQNDPIQQLSLVLDALKNLSLKPQSKKRRNKDIEL